MEAEAWIGSLFEAGSSFNASFSSLLMYFVVVAIIGTAQSEKCAGGVWAALLEELPPGAISEDTWLHHGKRVVWPAKRRTCALYLSEVEARPAL